MTLQHLRSSTANKRPDPTAMADGQLAINTPAVSPGLFFKDAAGALVKVGPVHVGTTAPNASPASGGTAGNSVGEQWLDTTGGTYVFKVWDGSAWRSESGTFVDVNGDVMTGALVMDNQQQVRFRETTANGTNYIALQAPASVASDKTITLPDQNGSVLVSGNASIVNADVNASAAIAGTKISPDFGSQTITTTGIVSAALGAAATPSITFTGDTNTGIYSPGADQLAISTGGSGRLFVDASGNVKITSSQYQAIAHKKISANAGYGAVVIGLGSGSQGNISLGFDVSTTTGFNFTGNAQTYFHPNGALIPNNAGTDYIGLFSRDSSNSILLGPALSSGKANGPLTLTSTSVGIGTTSPSSLLHLADAGHITVGTTTGTKIGTATTQKIGFYNATPVVQPTAVADATTAVDVITQLNALLAKLRTLGIIAT